MAAAGHRAKFDYFPKHTKPNITWWKTYL